MPRCLACWLKHTYLIRSHVGVLDEFQKIVGRRLGVRRDDGEHGHGQDQQPGRRSSQEKPTDSVRHRSGRCDGDIEIDAVAALNRPPYHPGIDMTQDEHEKLCRHRSSQCRQRVKSRGIDVGQGPCPHCQSVFFPEVVVENPKSWRGFGTAILLQFSPTCELFLCVERQRLAASFL